MALPSVDRRHRVEIDNGSSGEMSSTTVLIATADGENDSYHVHIGVTAAVLTTTHSMMYTSPSC